jgi:hypothetical protein
MFDVQKGDFILLDEFEYIYYWTDPDVFPEKVLVNIRVLNATKAEELEKFLLKDCQTLSQFLFQGILGSSIQLTPFLTVERLHVNQHSKEQVRDWLMTQKIVPEMPFFLSWNRTTAVLVPWNIFCNYWDAFCFAGLDDICICSKDENWRLLYYHEGIFLIGRKQ